MKSMTRRLIFTACLCAICFVCSLFVSAAAEPTVSVGSATELKSAFNTLSSTGGKISLSGNISISSATTLPANYGKITIDGCGHTLTLGANIAFNGDVDIDNIVISQNGNYRAFLCNGNAVHFGRNITCPAVSNNYPSIMAGCSAQTSFNGGSLTIDGGTWQRVRGGNASTSSIPAAQISTVTINGGRITEFLQVCGAGATEVGSEFSVVINGGDITNIRFFSANATSAANTALIINGGTVKGKISPSTAASTATINGTCSIRLIGGDYSMLTEIEGYSGNGDLTVDITLSDTLAAPIHEDVIGGTMIRQGVADPCLIFFEDNYYLTMTGSSNIAMIKSDTLGGLSDTAQTLGDNLVYKSALDSTAINTFGYTSIDGTWSPELHYFSAEDFGAEYAGWYMYLALRKEGIDSSNIRMVTLRSNIGDTPDGPYVNPTTGEAYASQPLLDKNGNIITEWGCGETILRIPSGEHHGIYAMWVAEEYRNTADFRQKIMIAKMRSPWQLENDPVAMLYPTQYWETIGSGKSGGKYMPKVVEGVAPLYGENGEIFIIYCGSGYWTNYGLGQLTWTGGNPMLASSWVKYENNPVFGANDADGNHHYGVMMQGAGHAFFVRDVSDNLFAVYHAYTADENGNNKGSARNAYMEPCYIDYSMPNGVGNGVLRFTNGNKPADTSMSLGFSRGEAYNVSAALDLVRGFDINIDSTASISASGRDGQISLNVDYSASVSGCEIRKRVSGGGDFTLLANLTGGTKNYTDSDIVTNTDYDYIAVPYIDYGGTRYYGAATEIATAQVTFVAPTVRVGNLYPLPIVKIQLSHTDTVDGYRIYKYDHADGAAAKTLLAEITENVFEDENVELEHTYVYSATAVINGKESACTDEISVYVEPPRLELSLKTVAGGGIQVTVTDRLTADSYEFSRDGVILANTASKTYTDTDVVPGEEYFYKVTAYENGEAVENVYGSCTACDTTPSLKVSISQDKSLLTVEIGGVSGAVTYKLYCDDEMVGWYNGAITASLDNTFADGSHTFRLDAIDIGGNVIGSVSKTIVIGGAYNADYDINNDGFCDIFDALLLLRQILGGGSGTLRDVILALKFISA